MSIWIQITSGEGPDECGWVVGKVAEQLQQHLESLGCEVTTLEAIEGGHSETFKSILLAVEVEGEPPDLTDWLGTIQWIGQSPFRPNHKRKNWFVGVECFLPIEQSRWSESELKVEVMRSSGPGGQHANKTSSAVRITHIPTGLQASAQEERSQIHNKKLALARLAAKFESEHSKVEGDNRNQRWQEHHHLVRGEAVRVYEGKHFRLKRAS